MRKIYTLLFFAIVACANLNAQNFPFPQQTQFESCIQPNHKSQAELGMAVVDMYESWKADFLKETIYYDGYYVLGECTGCTVESKGTSEGQGYGMIITVLMAGYDPDAKMYFDGLYNFFDNYRSQTNDELMNWSVATDERDPWTGSATDGDMDIAYALLLAHYQWGSDGEIDYLNAAIGMINKGLKVGDMNTSSKRVMLGDWDSDPLTTRPSDWMTGHFNAYAEATGDDFWIEANETIYEMVETIQKNNSPETGLMPDFVVGNTAKPSGPNFLEGPNDGSYYYNACRFPWRVANDFLHYGSIESKQALELFLQWAETEIDGNFNNYTAGYKLDGTALNEYTDMSFTAPLVLAFTTDSAYQETLNKGWDYIERTYSSYFDASLNTLCQLLITGNWWAPVASTAISSPDLVLAQPLNGQTFGVNKEAIFKFGGDDVANIKELTVYRTGKKTVVITEAPFEYTYLVDKTGTHELKVLVELNNGKYLINKVYIKGSNSVSIQQNKANFNCYPNPVDNELSIQWKNDMDCDNIQIFNLHGLIIKEFPTPQAAVQFSIDVSDLTPGIYFIKGNGLSSNAMLRFVKN